MTRRWFVLLESNTTGTGRDFALAARELGLRPVLFTRAPHRYPYVDELGLDVRELDTSAPAAVAVAGRQLAGEVAGITSSSEYFVAEAATAGRSLGLATPDPAAIGRCRDKAVQRRVLRDRGVPVPDSVVCRTETEALSAAAGIAGPVVVKPVSGSGSEGVRGFTGPGPAGEWAARLLDRARRVLVER
ncbi:argininosuccinate lyase, partial [Amycolatopsis sp. NPDC049252]